MCVPTVLAILVLKVFTVFLIVFAIAAFAHFVLKMPLAGTIFDMLLRRKTGVMDIDGRPVAYIYKAANRSDRSSLELTYTAPFAATAAFRRKTKLDEIGENIALNKQVQINDPVLSQSVYAQCEDQAFVSNLLASPEAKDELKRMLELFDSLEIKNELCVLTKTPCPDFHQMRMHDMAAAAGAMLALTDRIPQPQPGLASLTPLTDNSRRLEGLLKKISWTLFICGGALAFWGFNAFKPLFYWQSLKTALWPGVALAVIYISYIFDRVKGSSYGMEILKNNGISGSIGIILAFWGGLMLANGVQDLSAVTRYELNVTSMHFGNKGDSVVRLTSPSGAIPLYKFSPRRNEYNLLEVGDRCVLLTRRGLLGFEWRAGLMCGGRGRYIASGTTDGVTTETGWRFWAGVLREIAPPAAEMPQI